jgi:hypothetical protein
MATFRKKRSRQYKRRNTRRNIRRNTRRKYIKARKSRINRRTRKSLEGGLKFPSFSFLTRRSAAAVAPAPNDRPQIDPLSISGESNNTKSLLHKDNAYEYNEDKTSSIQLDAAKQINERIDRQMDMDMGMQLMKQKKTAEERENEDALFAESLQKLSIEDKKKLYAIEELRIPLKKKPAFI